MSSALLLGLQLALAPVPRPAPRYHLALDGPITLAAAGGWLGLSLAAPGLTRTSCPCARDQVPRFDRFAVDARWSGGGATAGAIVAVSLLGSAAALAASDARVLPAARDVALAGEAAILAGLVTQVAKVAFARPYPFMYRSGITADQQGDGINYASMWSGHTAVPMAAAVAAARLLDLRGAPRALRIAVWIAGSLLAAGAGALEVSAGNHFPSDVLVGGAIGAAVGWTVVEIHIL